VCVHVCVNVCASVCAWVCEYVCSCVCVSVCALVYEGMREWAVSVFLPNSKSQGYLLCDVLQAGWPSSRFLFS